MSYPIVKTTSAKAVVSAIGGFISVLAAVFADDVLDTSEVGGLVAGLILLVMTVAGVWRTENKPVRRT